MVSSRWAANCRRSALGSQGRRLNDEPRRVSARSVDDQDLYTIVITTYIPPRQVGDGPWTPWYADYYHPAV